MKRVYQTSTLSAACLILASCATVPQDGGLSKLEPILTEYEAGSMAALQDALSEEELANALSSPISALVSEEIALRNNPLIEANLAEVGIAEADYVQAGRIRNPGVSYERISSEEYQWTVLFDLSGLLFLPLRRQVAGRGLELERYRAAQAVLNQVARTRNAWIDAVAERQKLLLLEQIHESFETTHALTEQMTAIGHSSTLEKALSELALGEIRTSLARQRLLTGGSREDLIQNLGLWGENASKVVIPERLPDMPSEFEPVQAVERQAIERRLDVRLAKFNLEFMASNLKLTESSRFVNVIEAGPKFETTESERETGFELEFSIPIFDPGGAKTAKGRYLVERAQARAESTAIGAASNVRKAYGAYQATYQIAKHYESTLLPLRQRISAEQLLRYNGMLISVFDLLTDMRSRVQLHMSYVDAVRDYWLADTQFKYALIGTGSDGLDLTGTAGLPVAESDPGH